MTDRAYSNGHRANHLGFHHNTVETDDMQFGFI